MVGKRVNNIDLRICGNIRNMRKMLGMSQQVLANMIGLTSQQLHKYETGMDRVSAGILAKIAQAFNCNVSDLYYENNSDIDEKKENYQELKVAETGKKIKSKDEKEDLVALIKMLLDMPKQEREKLLEEMKQKTIKKS